MSETIPNVVTEVVDKILSTRELLEAEEVDLEIFLELQFVPESTALALETASNGVVLDQFCGCIKQQVNSETVELEAARSNASLFARDGNRCEIMQTSRIYDPEAINIFGKDHLSIQVHVSQEVDVVAAQTLAKQRATEILGSGFDVETGGQTQFLDCLQEFEAFQKVILVDRKEGLADSESPPSGSPADTSPPTLRPTSRPTLRPTASPSSAPSKRPTQPPTTRPTSLPSASPSRAPTILPTWIPTSSPSATPTVSPTSKPTMLAIDTQQSLTPTMSQTSMEPNGVNTPHDMPAVVTSPSANALLDGNLGYKTPPIDPLIIAAIAGGVTTLLVVCLCTLLYCWRKKRLYSHRRHRTKYALTSRDGERSKRGHDFIPGIVQLDQRSLAETSLGDQTAGRKKSIRPKRVSSQAIQPVQSFDDSSLYTTPFSVRDDGSRSRPLSGTSNFSSQLARPIDYDRKILYPLSDSTTTSSDGLSSFGPHTGRISTDSSLVGRENPMSDRSGGPIDLDTNSPYRATIKNATVDSQVQTDDLEEDVAIARIVGPIDLDTNSPYRVTRTNAMAKMSFPVPEEDASTSFDMDTWSFDFEDFDRKSNIDGEEPISRSPSHSSKTTVQVRNVANVNDSIGGSSQATSQNDSQDTLEHTRPTGLEDFPDPDNSTIERLYRTLMADKQILQSSPISHKSLPSQPSISSRSSFGSKKVQIGQPPSLLSDSATMAGQSSAQMIDKLPSPLSKLLDSVAEATSPKMIASVQQPPPVVSPENPEPDTDDGMSKEDDSTTLVGLQFRDDVSGSSASTGMSPSPWLFEKVQESLGPKSVTADMESLSGKSHGRSSGSRAGSMVSFGSQLSHRSSVTHREISFQPRTLEHDLKRLEKQLAVMDVDQTSVSSTGVSSLTGQSMTRPRQHPSRMRTMVVLVPAGKLGVILANRHDGNGTIVSELRPNSPLTSMLAPGDRLVAVDDEDVSQWPVSKITAMIADRSNRERRMTVLTAAPIK